jgi:hypothetical protein
VSPFANPFIDCASPHLVTESSLPSVGTTTLGKEALLVLGCALFAECCGHCTRQRNSLSSVTFDNVTKNPFLFVFIIPSIQTKHISHNHHIYIIEFTESSHTS